MVKAKNMAAIAYLEMELVEVSGVEPLSRTGYIQATTSVVFVRFNSHIAQKQAV